MFLILDQGLKEVQLRVRAFIYPSTPSCPAEIGRNLIRSSRQGKFHKSKYQSIKYLWKLSQPILMDMLCSSF
jgi:hypothetical protein